MDEIKKNYQIQGEISNGEYEQLVDFINEECSSFLLVVRREVTLGPKAVSLLVKLKQNMIRSDVRSSWPGTDLEEGDAYVTEYHLNEQSAKIIKETAPDLFHWIQPRLPEDLCFLRQDKSPMFFSSTSKRQAFLVLTDDEKKKVEQNIQDIALTES
jgi:hypothetical protein